MSTHQRRIHQLMKGPRGALSLVIIILCVVGLAACGSDSATSTNTSTISASEVKDASGSIKVTGWQYYEAAKAQDAGAVKATWSYLATDKDLYTKTRGGKFDVASPSSLTIGPLGALGVLRPIDTSLLSNYDVIDPTLANDPIWKNADGQTVCVPFAVSPSFTAYDSADVPVAQNINDLLKPAYKDSIALADDAATIEQFAIAQGVKDTRKMTQAQLQSVMDFLDKLKPNVKTFFQFGEEAQLFSRNDVNVLTPAVGSYLGKAIETTPSIKFNFVAGVSLIDCWAVVGDANEAAALNWINATLSTPGQKAIVKASSSYPVNQAAVPELAKLGDPVSVATAEMSLPEILKEAPISHGFAVKSTGDNVTLDEVTRAWTRYKASF